MAIRAGSLFVALLSVTSLGACVDGPSAPLSAEEAPLGPNSMRIPGSTLDEYLRVAINRTGHIREYDFDPDSNDITVKVAPLSDHDYYERWVSRADAEVDRFFRRVDGVLMRSRTVDIDPEPRQANFSVANQQVLYQLGNKSLVYAQAEHVVTGYSSSCNPSGCTSEVYQEIFEPREYPKSAPPYGWASPEGLVLVLGEKVTTNRTGISFDFESREFRTYRLYSNFTAVREDVWRGDRVFLVNISGGREDISGRPRPAPTTPSTTPPTTASTTTTSQVPLPKATFETWFSAESPVPVRVVSKTPFRHEGSVYWTTTTAELQAYDRGQAVVPWGSVEPLPDIHALPGAGFVPATQWGDQASGGIVHPLSDAWKAVRNDPTLPRLQEQLTAFPQSIPYSGSYYPDAGRGAFSWNFRVGANGSQIRPADSREQFLGPASAGVAIVQNRESSSSFSSPSRLPADLAGLQLVNWNDVLDAYHRLQGGDKDPAISYLQSESSFTKQFTARASLGPGYVERTFGTVPYQVEFWRIESPWTLDLMDGGIVGRNVSYGGGINEWPWRPNISPPLQGEAHGLSAAAGPAAACPGAPANGADPYWTRLDDRSICPCVASRSADFGDGQTWTERVLVPS